MNQLALRSQPDLCRIVNNCSIVSEEVVLVCGFVVERCCNRAELLLKHIWNFACMLYGLEPSDSPALNTSQKSAVLTPLVFQLVIVIRMFHLPSR